MYVVEEHQGDFLMIRDTEDMVIEKWRSDDLVTLIKEHKLEDKFFNLRLTNDCVVVVPIDKTSIVCYCSQAKCEEGVNRNKFKFFIYDKPSIVSIYVSYKQLAELARVGYNVYCIPIEYYKDRIALFSRLEKCFGDWYFDMTKIRVRLKLLKGVELDNILGFTLSTISLKDTFSRRLDKQDFNALTLICDVKRSDNIRLGEFESRRLIRHIGNTLKSVSPNYYSEIISSATRYLERKVKEMGYLNILEVIVVDNMVFALRYKKDYLLSKFRKVEAINHVRDRKER